MWKWPLFGPVLSFFSSDPCRVLDLVVWPTVVFLGRSLGWILLTLPFFGRIEIAGRVFYFFFI